MGLIVRRMAGDQFTLARDELEPMRGDAHALLSDGAGTVMRSDGQPVTLTDVARNQQGFYTFAIQHP